MAGRLICACAVLTWLLVLAPLPAIAQVYEIGTAGEVSVREGGGVVVWHGPEQATSQRIISAPPHGPSSSATALQPVHIADALILAAQRYNLHPALLEALVWQESRWQVNAVSPKGAMGLTQLMPGTARELGVDASDPLANLDGGARYLRKMLDHFGGNLPLSLAAYNAGTRRVEASGGIPQIRETQNYVAAIMNRIALNQPELDRPDLNSSGTSNTPARR